MAGGLHVANKPWNIGACILNYYYHPHSETCHFSSPSTQSYPPAQSPQCPNRQTDREQQTVRQSRQTWTHKFNGCMRMARGSLLHVCYHIIADRLLHIYCEYSLSDRNNFSRLHSERAKTCLTSLCFIERRRGRRLSFSMSDSPLRRIIIDIEMANNVPFKRKVFCRAKPTIWDTIE